MPRPRKFGLTISTRLSDEDAEAFVRLLNERHMSPSELARELIGKALR